MTWTLFAVCFAVALLTAVLLTLAALGRVSEWRADAPPDPTRYED